MVIVLHKKTKKLLFLVPLSLLCLYVFIGSLSYELHDFLNSYFPALLTQEGIAPETVIFDIYNFNQYAWGLGYPGVLLDYYLNSPFTATAFYPLAFIKNPVLAKAIFNLFSIFLFLIAVYKLGLKVLKEDFWVLLFLPIIFYVPIRNQILFGQSYFLIFFLVVIGYLQFVKGRDGTGAGLLSLAILLKFFPVFYGLPLLFAKRWRPIFYGMVITLVFVLLAMYLTGYSLWEYYFTEVLPIAIKNKTTIDFRVNYQSLDVFFKTLFVQDDYYNPNVLIANERLSILASWIVKSIVLGGALFLSINRRKELLSLMAIWVVTLFLLQSRTATYAQILWIIPAFVVFKSEMNIRLKFLFTGILLLVCNFPFHVLANTSIMFRFLRLWLTLGIAVLFYRGMSKKWDLKYTMGAFVLFLPMNLGAFTETVRSVSEYVLTEKKYFMVCDIQEKNGFLAYHALGRKGLEEVSTNIIVKSFEPERCTIKNNQVFVDGKQITVTNSLKKKPILINNCEVYFLTDHRSRHGAYTLKKANVCSAKNKNE